MGISNSRSLLVALVLLRIARLACTPLSPRRAGAAQSKAAGAQPSFKKLTLSFVLPSRPLCLKILYLTHPQTSIIPSDKDPALVEELVHLAFLPLHPHTQLHHHRQHFITHPPLCTDPMPLRQKQVQFPSYVEPMLQDQL